MFGESESGHCLLISRSFESCSDAVELLCWSRAWNFRRWTPVVCDGVAKANVKFDAMLSGDRNEQCRWVLFNPLNTRRKFFSPRVFIETRLRFDCSSLRLRFSSIAETTLEQMRPSRIIEHLTTLWSMMIDLRRAKNNTGRFDVWRAREMDAVSSPCQSNHSSVRAALGEVFFSSRSSEAVSRRWLMSFYELRSRRIASNWTTCSSFFFSLSNRFTWAENEHRRQTR